MARILVVDDEEPVRELLLGLLRLHGHEVDSAADGAEAIECLRKKPYDLMITDRNMPRLSGIQAIAIIRSSPKFAQLKILMATVDSQVKNVDEAYEAGVDGYIVKPFDLKKVLEKVAMVLDKSKEA